MLPLAKEAGRVNGHGQAGMRFRGEERTSGVAAALALAGLLIAGCSDARAQKTSKPSRASPVWLDCQKASPDIAPAIEAARNLLDQAWLASRGSYFAGYTMPGEKRSPFDLSPREPDSGPTDGFVEARTPHCVYSTSGGAAPAHHVRFISPFYRFHEADHGWSPPLRNGLMLDAIVSRTDTGWKVEVPPSEQTILLPEQKPRRPDATKLPPDAAWAEPIPGCSRRQTWNGTDCAPRKR